MLLLHLTVCVVRAVQVEAETIAYPVDIKSAMPVSPAGNSEGAARESRGNGVTHDGSKLRSENLKWLGASRLSTAVELSTSYYHTLYTFSPQTHMLSKHIQLERYMSRFKILLS